VARQPIEWLMSAGLDNWTKFPSVLPNGLDHETSGVCRGVAFELRKLNE
jgi:hypothetical protein